MCSPVFTKKCYGHSDLWVCVKAVCFDQFKYISAVSSNNSEVRSMKNTVNDLWHRTSQYNATVTILYEVYQPAFAYIVYNEWSPKNLLI